jgi:hypothetical protein
MSDQSEDFFGALLRDGAIQSVDVDMAYGTVQRRVHHVRRRRMALVSGAACIALFGGVVFAGSRVGSSDDGQPGSPATDERGNLIPVASTTLVPTDVAVAELEITTTTDTSTPATTESAADDDITPGGPPSTQAHTSGGGNGGGPNTTDNDSHDQPDTTDDDHHGGDDGGGDDGASDDSVHDSVHESGRHDAGRGGDTVPDDTAGEDGEFSGN